MIRSFDQAVSFLEKRLPNATYVHPGKPGLARMEYVMALLGNPHRAYDVIHVAGTSGKGSTASYIAALLDEENVGLYTSPHLEKITERIRVGGNDIDEAAFVDLLDSMSTVIDQVDRSPHGPLSYFEILTAMGFLYFYRKKVLVAVIEVGLGGTYDATNVVTPAVSVITTIGKDHTELLGNTVASITREKAGIIKEGAVVVSGVTQPSVRACIAKICRQRRVPYSFLGKDYSYTVHSMTSHGSGFDFEGKERISGISLAMVGVHQIENAATAIEAVLRYERSRPHVERLAAVRVPARFEIIRTDPTVILDGAHNPDKMRSAVAAFRMLFPRKRCNVVLAMKRDKNVRAVLRILTPVVNRYIVTRFTLAGDMGTSLSYAPDELIAKAGSMMPAKRVRAVDDAKEAIALALRETGSSNILLVTGSLYLVGEVRQLCKRLPTY